MKGISRRNFGRNQVRIKLELLSVRFNCQTNTRIETIKGQGKKNREYLYEVFVAVASIQLSFGIS